MISVSDMDNILNNDLIINEEIDNELFDEYESNEEVDLFMEKVFPELNNEYISALESTVEFDTEEDCMIQEGKEETKKQFFDPKLDKLLKEKGLDEEDIKEIKLNIKEYIEHDPRLYKLNKGVDRINDLLSNIVCLVGTSMGYFMCVKIIASMFVDAGFSLLQGWVISTLFSCLGFILKVISMVLTKKGTLKNMW